MLYEGKDASASRSKRRPDAIELFLAGYVPLLRALAKRFFCVSLSVQDLCQAGYIGLMLALEHYNAEQGAEFITYAMPWALGEMKKALRQADDFTGAQRFGRQVSRELRRLSASLGREPRIEELAQACHASPSDVVCALEAGYAPHVARRTGSEHGANAARRFGRGRFHRRPEAGYSPCAYAPSDSAAKSDHFCAMCGSTRRRKPRKSWASARAKSAESSGRH